MYWLIYTVTGDGRHILQIVQSDDKPTGGQVINHGFTTPAQVLSVMAHYLTVDDAGFLRANDLTAHQLPTWGERFFLRFHIAPWMAGIVIGSGIISVATLLLLLVHVR